MQDAEATNADGRARILVAATCKGGAGKSTTIACLASYWLGAGHRVALLDADPNRTLSRWHAKGDGLARATLRSEAAEDRLVGAVSDLADAHDLVLVDCPGFGAQANLFAIGTADLVLIPAMTDEANLFEALRMRRIVESTSHLTRRPIASRTLLTRVKRSGVAEHSHRQLLALGAQPLQARIPDRAIYQEASFHGASPLALDRRGPAARDIARLAAELEALAWWRAGAVPALAEA